tara:strand:+ start:487 stop:1203 length:717 start_codon:yes stop_codon:yes gene_type:complete
MANQRDIDSSSEQIANLVDKARAELVSSLYLIGKEIGDVGEFAEALLTIDIEGSLKSKLQKATSIYANAHRNVLESTIGFADINPRALATFATLNEQLFDNAIIRTISGNIRTQVVRGLQAGMTALEITEGVVSSSISNAQMQTLVNTTLNSYSRQVTNQMMDIAPSNTKYVYIGPVDEKTRDECLQMASAGRLTLDQIKSQFGEAVLVDGGGFNCRHKWEIASEEGTQFFEGDKVDA